MKLEDAADLDQDKLRRLMCGLSEMKGKLKNEGAGVRGDSCGGKVGKHGGKMQDGGMVAVVKVSGKGPPPVKVSGKGPPQPKRTSKKKPDEGKLDTVE